MKYNYDIKYLSGYDNKLADGLWCAPLKQCYDNCDVDDEQICEIVQNDMQNDIPVTLVELQTSTESTVVLSEIAGHANSKWPDKRDCIDLIFFIDRLKRQDFGILDSIPKVLIIAFNNIEKQTL